MGVLQLGELFILPFCMHELPMPVMLLRRDMFEPSVVVRKQTWLTKPACAVPGNETCLGPKRSQWHASHSRAGNAIHSDCDTQHRILSILYVHNTLQVSYRCTHWMWSELQHHLIADVSLSICFLACEVFTHGLQLISAASKECPAGLSGRTH